MNNTTVLQTNNQVSDIINEVKKVVLGKDGIIEKILLTMLAGGHLLMDDIPGVGKTTVALAFSKAVSLDYNRMQFTPDVLPSDIMGFSVYNREKGQFEYRAGAALCNLFLADEINRTSSKTQSALLQIMEEAKVTVDGVTRETGKPFMVIATQNPIGSVGTQLLPESQMDRFMICIKMGYPDFEYEKEIIRTRQTVNPMMSVNSVATADDILRMQSDVNNIYIDDALLSYTVALVSRTRAHPMLKMGASPRASLALTQIAKARAYMYGRTYVQPDDISASYRDTVAHRVILSPRAKAAQMTAEDILHEIYSNIPIPTLSGR